MPLTSKGQEILAHMKKQYGAEKGEEVFYASKNAGTITGVDGVTYAWDDLWKDEVGAELREFDGKQGKPAQDARGPQTLTELNAANRKRWGG